MKTKTKTKTKKGTRRKAKLEQLYKVAFREFMRRLGPDFEPADYIRPFGFFCPKLPKSVSGNEQLLAAFVQDAWLLATMNSGPDGVSLSDSMFEWIFEARLQLPKAARAILEKVES